MAETLEQPKIESTTPDTNKENPNFNIKNFVFNPDEPKSAQMMALQMYQIDKMRFPGEDEFFTLEYFQKLVENTIPNDSNKGKANVILVLQNPEDQDVFGFIYTEPAENLYTPQSDNPKNNFHPERLQNPDIHNTAYITDAVLKKSGSGMLRKLAQMLEEILTSKGYKFADMDATTAGGLSDFILENYKDKIVLQEEHDSEYGRQVFIKIKIGND